MELLRAGIDVGGSSAKIGLVRADSGEIVVRRVVPGPRSGETAAQLVDRYCAAVAELAAEAGIERPAAIGIGVPGYVTPAGLPELTNVPILDGYPVVAHLADRFGVPVGIDNDANVAALGEYRYGAGRGARRLVLVTGGTGIGVAAVLDGELVAFTGHSTGCMGHIIVDPHSEHRCLVGCRGCLETLATAPALRRRAEATARLHPDGALGRTLARTGTVTVPDVKAAVAAGDAEATEILRETGWWMGIGMATFAAIFAPDRMLVGGGLSELGAPFHAGALAGLAHVGMPYSVDGLQVLPASLGNDAGIVGAACLD
jgi:glucokinase